MQTITSLKDLKKLAYTHVYSAKPEKEAYEPKRHGISINASKYFIGRKYNVVYSEQRRQELSERKPKPFINPFADEISFNFILAGTINKYKTK